MLSSRSIIPIKRGALLKRRQAVRIGLMEDSIEPSYFNIEDGYAERP